MAQPAGSTPEQSVPSNPPPRGLKLFATSVLAGIAGGLFGAIAAGLLGLSKMLAGGVAGTAMAILVALILIRERKRAAAAE
jgi:predicted lipid-binding transport protein (Tim44 family)